MEQITMILSEYGFIVAIILILIILLLVFFILYKMNNKKLKKKTDELNIRYNSLKSVPLSFKINKAEAIVKINQDSINLLNFCKEDHEKVLANIEHLTKISNDIDDNLASKKFKAVKELLIDFENCLEIGDNLSRKLEKNLDVILEKEIEQRNQVTEYKEKFRLLKTFFNENSKDYNIAMDEIENKLTNIESLFSIFEEWMYASDFKKTLEVLNDLNKEIEKLFKIQELIPDFISEIKVKTPLLLDELKRDYALCIQKNIYLDHINFESRYSELQELIKTNANNIKQCNTDDISESIKLIYEKLDKITKEIINEENSFYDVKNYLKEQESKFELINESVEYIK